jgi:hypothetical protein
VAAADMFPGVCDEKKMAGPSPTKTTPTRRPTKGLPVVL